MMMKIESWETAHQGCDEDEGGKNSDRKTSNAATGSVKLLDFGLSNLVKEADSDTTQTIEALSPAAADFV